MQPDFTEILQLLKSNNELVKENNVLLKKMHRSAVVAFWFRLLWIVVFLGLPFFIYYSILKPYLGEMSFSADATVERFEQIKNDLLKLEQLSDRVPQTQNGEVLAE